MKLKKTLAAVALALAVPVAAHAGITFSPQGNGSTIDLGTFDWGPNSLAGVGSIQAINNFIANEINANDPNWNPLSVQFEVLVHASLIGTLNSAGLGNTPSGLGNTFEITMNGGFTQTVTGVFTAGSTGIATFQNTGAGFLEMWYDKSVNANPLEGSGYNDGRLIMSASGASVADGFFQTSLTTSPVVMDQFGTNQYPGQTTVTGNGSNGNIAVTGLVADPTFFIAIPASINLQFANISEALPFISNDPSDCFTPTASGTAVGSTRVGAAQCAAGDHVLGTYAAQPVQANGGYLPVVGIPNGDPGPDIVVQTDFNSPINGIPEPTSLALMGLALVSAATLGKRRRKS